MQHRVWRAKVYDIPETARLSVEARISPLLAQLLLNRGIRDAADARRFLSPSFADVHDPNRLPGYVPAVKRLRRALDTGERIVIYGDYDVDGTSATALLIGVLRKLGGDIRYYIPNRQTEGYGMNVDAMRRIKEELEADVLLTVDCGITADEPIAEACRLGVDVIVTDHHSVDAQRLPLSNSVVALIDPKLDGHDYPFRELAGVGLAFKLAQGVIGCSLEDAEPLLTAQLDLVALGTIADVAELRDENRVLAKFGLDVLTRRERVGLRALCDVAGIKRDAKVSSRDIGFRLGPRINAAGRLDTAHKVVTLLTTDSEAEATDIAKTLNDENASRQNVERRITEEAIALIEAKVNLAEDRAILLANEGWHVGVVGIVAQRLVERYNRPVVLIALDGDTGRGSGRSIPDFDLHDALIESRSYMLNFGGHAAAAGMTVEKKAVKRLRESFLRTARQRLTPDDLRPRLNLDAILPLDALTLDAISELDCLEPLGDTNPPPKVAVRGLRVLREPLAMGAERRHVKVFLTDGQNTISAVRWNAADDLAPLKTSGAEVDVAGSVSVNEYQFERSVQIIADDWIIHTQSPPVDKGIFPRREHPSAVKIVDNRTRRDKTAYLQRLLARREPALIYVRDETAADEARQWMREHSLVFVEATPDAKPDALHDVVRRFLDANPPILLAQSSVTPFAEPSAWRRTLRHIIFCHPLPDEATFLERAAPAVYRWQETPSVQDDATYVHLLFNDDDLANESKRVRTQHPTAETLRDAAKTLRARTGSNGMTLDEWASAAKNLEPATLRAIAQILEELGFVKETKYGKITRFVWVEGVRRELEESARYREGLIAHKRWELTATRWRRATVRDFWDDLRRYAQTVASKTE